MEEKYIKHRYDPIIPSKNERELRRIRPLVERINQLEGEVSGLSDAELHAKTGAFRQRLEQGATPDELLPEAFAVVREASKRVLQNWPKSPACWQYSGFLTRGLAFSTLRFRVGSSWTLMPKP